MTLLRYNCPNCGAGITGESCEFCGTVIYDFAAIQLGKPSYVKFMKDDQIYIFRMYVDNLSIRHEVDAVDLADDCRGFPIFIPARTHMSLSLDAHCVPDHDGALMRVVKS